MRSFPSRVLLRLDDFSRRAGIAGRATDAVRLADALLTRAPGNRDAADVKIRALVSLDERQGARAAYDAFVVAAKAEDARLMSVVAVAELRAIAAEAADDPYLRMAALERIAKTGDRAAYDEMQRLSQQAPGGPQGILADAALARLGDPGAANRLAEAASGDLRDKSIVADAMRSANARDQVGVLVPLLDDDQAPLTRIRAAEALGALGYTAAIPQLRALLSDPRPSVATAAAVALKRLGDHAGDEIVAGMASSSIAGTRLQGIEASRPITAADRRAAIGQLSTDRDPFNQVKAAELLGRDDPAAARTALVEILGHGDIAVRREAASVLETLALYDLTLFHRLLADASPWIRLFAAGGVLNAIHTT